MERTIAAIWQELFDNPQISLEGNFFDLGGHSLLSAQAHQKLQKALGCLGRRLLLYSSIHRFVCLRGNSMAGTRPRLAVNDLRERARRQHEAAARTAPAQNDNARNRTAQTRSAT